LPYPFAVPEPFKDTAAWAIVDFIVLPVIIKLEPQIIIRSPLEGQGVFESGLYLNPPTVRSFSVITWAKHLVQSYLILKCGNNFADITNQSAINSEGLVGEGILQFIYSRKDERERVSNRLSLRHRQLKLTAIAWLADDLRTRYLFCPSVWPISSTEAVPRASRVGCAFAFFQGSGLDNLVQTPVSFIPIDVPFLD